MQAQQPWGPKCRPGYKTQHQSQLKTETKLDSTMTWTEPLTKFLIIDLMKTRLNFFHNMMDGNKTLEPGNSLVFPSQ